jgi:hypothetical protein
VSVVLRWIAGDRITGACPNRVLERTEEYVVLFQPAGTLWRHARGTRGGPRGRNLLPEHPITGHDEVEWVGKGVARAHRFGEPWSVWRWFEPRGGWSDDFYVNLEDPWRETSLGFDSGDWVLDLVASADGTWRYKDLDELEWIESLEPGGAWAPRVRSAGLRAAAAIEGGAWPFAADWDAWSPGLASRGATPLLPVLPDDWDRDVTTGTGR